jgi:plastocyanin
VCRSFLFLWPHSLTVAQALQAGNDFGFELLRRLHAERSDDAANVFISPLSLSMALGMLLNATGGETFNAMADALGLNGPLMTEANDAYIPFTLSRYFRGREGTAQQGPKGPVGAEVTMNDQLRYEPAVVTISAGQAVRWRNPSAVVYTVTTDPSKAMQAGIVRLPSGVDAFNSGDIGPGGASPGHSPSRGSTGTSASHTKKTR